MKFHPCEIGNNEILEQLEKLNIFVKENFETLYEGAIRLGLNSESDQYNPKKIIITDKNRFWAFGGATEISSFHLIESAGGYKANCGMNIKESHLNTTIKDINLLITAANKNIKSKLTIKYPNC